MGSTLIFFICTRPFDQFIGSSFIYFIYSLVDNHSTKKMSSLIYFFHLHTTIWQTFKNFLSFIISLCTTIQSKNRVLINFLFLFVHDHSTMLGVTLTLLFILFLDVPKFSLLYSWQTLPLYYDRSVFGSTAFTFRPLYSN